MKNPLITKFALAILALGLLGGCTSRSGPPASVQYDQAISPYHVVKKGDSIASIARKYGMDKRELIRTNGLESPYRIVKGQRLLVRPHRASAAQDNRDETEMPATEEVGYVPEEGEVQVKPLAPVSGEPGQKDGIESEGRLNPERDDEGDGQESQGPLNNRRYDEERIDEDESRIKQQSRDQSTSSMPVAGGYAWPARGVVTRGFSPSGKGKVQNDGINIAAAKGSPVVAANTGTVAHVGNQLRGFGNVVLVKHKNEGTMTVYAHLDKIYVKKDEVVSRGQKLGTIGQTGTVTEPQLHFEIRKGRKPIDPNKYLQNSAAPAA